MTQKEIKIPNPEVEELALLGCILHEPDIIPDVQDKVTVTDFYDRRNLSVYDAMIRAYTTHGTCTMQDVVTVMVESSHKQASVIDYLAELWEQVPHANGWERFATKVTEYSRRRKAIETFDEATSKAADIGTPLENTMSDVMETSMDLTGEKTDDEYTAGQLVDATVSTLEYKAENGFIDGIRSGFNVIDETTAGFQEGVMYILGARPSIGKTALALEIALQAAIQEQPVAFFSVEMHPQQLMKRVLGSMAGVHPRAMRQPDMMKADDWKRIEEAKRQLKKLPFHVIHCAGLTADQYQAKAKRMLMKNGTKLCIADHFHLFSHPSPDASGLGVSSQKIQQATSMLGISTLLLCQLNRSNEHGADTKLPQLTHLRGTGTLEQDADTIMLLHRPDYYKEREDPKYEPTGEAFINVAKNRDGEVGCLKLRFDAGRFSSWRDEF